MDHANYMARALELARSALDRGEFPVGCVMVYQEDIIANGARRHTRGHARNEIDHAEMIALRRLTELPEAVDTSRVIVYCTMEPCLMCLAALVLNGIRTVVYAYEDIMGGGTGCNLTQLKPLYSSHPVKIVPHILRDRSVALFKTFFADPQNDYWQDSLLAKYTLNQ